jgi:subtilisin family serine protease
MTDWQQWSTREPNRDDSRLIEALSAERADLATRDGVSHEWLSRARDHPREETGPGGTVAAVSRPGAGTRTFVAEHLVTLTCQVPQAMAWVEAELGVQASVVEQDSRIAVTLLHLDGRVDPAKTLDAVLAQSRRATADRLTIGLDDITMQSWPVKKAGQQGAPQRCSATLGARPTGTGVGAGVRVAVIDGGFEVSAHRRTDGWDDNVIAPPDAPLDADGDFVLDDGAGHGTFVSGVVAQVAPDCEIRQYRALNSLGLGSAWRLKNAIFRAVDEGCRVINLSVAFDDAGLIGSPALSACLHLVSSQVAVIAAAGNDGTAIPVLPGYHQHCVAVGALEQDLRPCVWSSRGGEHLRRRPRHRP